MLCVCDGDVMDVTMGSALLFIVRSRLLVYSAITYLITGLFAELPGQSCHGFNGQA